LNPFQNSQPATPVRLGIIGCGDVLDPEFVVLGGGLGLAGAAFASQIN